MTTISTCPNSLCEHRNSFGYCSLNGGCIFTNKTNEKGGHVQMNDPIANEIYQLINEAVYHRKKQRITVKEIEKRTGVGSASWYSWIEGRCYPSLYAFIAFLSAIGLKLRIEKKMVDGQIEKGMAQNEY